MTNNFIWYRRNLNFYKILLLRYLKMFSTYQTKTFWFSIFCLMADGAFCKHSFQTLLVIKIKFLDRQQQNEKDRFLKDSKFQFDRNGIYLHLENNRKILSKWRGHSYQWFQRSPLQPHIQFQRDAKYPFFKQAILA